MGRESTITADQVNAIADTIKAEGGKPTSRAIRERLGNTGSMGTINKLLQKWKVAHTRQTSATIVLPVQVQNVLLDFMDQELTIARAALETELAEQHQEAADLASENERQGETIDGLTEQVSLLSAEKASVEGKATQLAADLHTAHQEALAERQAAEHARTELAKALLRLEAMPRLVDDLESARTDLGRERDARTEAERKAAVLQAQKDDVHARLAAVEDEVRRGRDELTALTLAHRGEVEAQSKASAAELARVREEAAAELQRNRAEAAARISEARADAGRAAEQVQRMQERVDAIAAELGKAHAEAKIAGEEAAELRGKLAVLPIPEDDGKPASAKPGSVRKGKHDAT
jgi:DNA repair exonuclease SbcCD ATPase subunit